MEPKIQWPRRSVGFTIGGDRQFVAPNEPAGLVINYLLKSAAPDKVKVRITDPYGVEVAVIDGPAAAGLNSVVWDFRRTAAPTRQRLRPGSGAASAAAACASRLPESTS